jgi:restriction endonuclease S subunit
VIGRGPSVMHLAEFVNGNAYKPADFSDTGTPVVRIRQLLDESAELDLAPVPDRPVWLTDGDLVFSWSATLAVRFWNRGKALLNQHLFRVDVHSSVDRRWFAYVLEEGTRRLEPLMHGSAMTHITRDMLKALTVACPVIATQRAIADYLDDETARIDSLIAAKQKMVALLDERRESSAAALIERANTAGDRTPLWALMRPQELTGAPELEVLSVYRDYGVIPKASRSDNYNKTPDDLSKYQVVTRGDVVVNKMKAWQGSIGVSNCHGIISPDYLVCKATRPIDPRYLHHVLRSPQVRIEFRRRSEGIRPSQWRLQWDQMRVIEIPVPNDETQIDIVGSHAHEVTRLQELASALKRQMGLLEERRQALVAEAVTGQLDIPVAA